MSCEGKKYVFGSVRNNATIANAHQLPPGYQQSHTPRYQEANMMSLGDSYAMSRVQAPAERQYSLPRNNQPQIISGTAGPSYSVQTAETQPYFGAQSLPDQSPSPPSTPQASHLETSVEATVGYSSPVDYSMMAKERGEVKQDAEGLHARIMEELQAMGQQVHLN